MTLAANGAMSVGGNVANRSINLELGRAFNFPNSAIGSAAFRTLAGVASGAIRLGADFYGKGFSLSQLIEIFGEANSGGTAYAEYTFSTDGTITGGVSQSGAYSVGNWTTPTTVGVGSSYWIRVTETSNSGPSTEYGDTRGVWNQLSSSRTYGVSKTANGLSTRVYTIEISSDSGGATIVATASVQYNVEIIF